MHPNVDVIVFGAGAMGSFFGGLLSRRNHVTLVCRKEHGDAIKRAGLRITGKTSIVARPDVTTTVAGVALLVALVAGLWRQREKRRAAR